MDDSQIFLYLNGELTDSEKTEVENWISKNPKKFTSIKLIWNNSKLDLQVKPNLEKAWQKKKKKVERPADNPELKQPFRIGKLIRHAAILLLFVVAGALLYKFLPPSKANEWIEIASTDDKIRSFVIQDGNTITLNIGSTLYALKSPNPTKREVKLEGEAYFEIVKDHKRPFYVYAEGTVTRVLGTSFNIKANTASNVKVSVSGGKVLFYPADKPDNNTRLVAGQAGVFDMDQKLLTKEEIQDPNLLAWKTHTLIFEKKPLAEVCRTLSQYYKKRISIEGPALNNHELTARYQDKSIDEVLQLLCLTFDIHYRIKGNDIELFD